MSNSTTRQARDIERFALELIKPGVTQAEAYRSAFPKAKKWADKTVWETASRLARDGKVQARVRELMQRVSDDGVADAKALRERFARIAFAPMPKKVSVKDMVAAGRELGKHIGFYEKDNQQKADPLVALLERINGSVLKPGAA